MRPFHPTAGRCRPAAAPPQAGDPPRRPARTPDLDGRRSDLISGHLRNPCLDRRCFHVHHSHIAPIPRSSPPSCPSEQRQFARGRPACSWFPSRTGHERVRPQRRDRSGFDEALVRLVLGWSAGPRGVVTSPVAAHAVLGDFHRCLLTVLIVTALPMGRKPGEISPFVPPAVNP